MTPESEKKEIVDAKTSMRPTPVELWWGHVTLLPPLAEVVARDLFQQPAEVLPG